MRELVAIALFVSLAFPSLGQQQYTFTNYMLNNYYYNPAIAGSRDVHVANLGYRNQWSGFDEAPVTFMGNFYGSIKNKGKMGYGATILSDRTGLTNTTAAYVNYAHHFQLTKSTKLGLGVRPGYMQYRVRLYDARVADPGDGVLTGNILAANALDVSTGFHIYSKDFYLMGSMQHALGTEIKFTSYNDNFQRHFTFITGYRLNFEKQKLQLEPSLMLRHVRPIPLQWSAMLRATYDKQYWIGMSYRTDDAMSVALGYTLKERLTIGYAYDFSMSEIAPYQTGSHEIVLSFVLTRNRPNLDDQDEELNKSIMDELKRKLEEGK